MHLPGSQHVSSLRLHVGSNEPTDGELLERFIHQKDDEAFSQLMARHSRMVYAVARRLVNNTADADDISQATFLLLARKAERLDTTRSVAGWLVGVVRRLAADVRKIQQRRERHERIAAHTKVSSYPPASALSASQELGQKMDEALAHLPTKYREPLLLCYWEGLSKPQATARLGWKPGTLSGRLARGKSLLKLRLERQGIVPGVILAWFSGAGQSQALPSLLHNNIARQALTHLPGIRPLVSPYVYQLVQGAIRSMFHTQLKWAAAVLVTISTLGLLGLCILSPSQADDAPKIKSTITTTANQTAKTDLEKIQGKWLCVSAVLGGKIPQSERQNAEGIRDKTWMEFSGDQIRLSGSPAEKQPVKFSLRSDVAPKQINIDAGQFKLNGLYTLEDGLLVVRFHANGTELPKSFALGEDSAGILFIMQRERPASMGKATELGGIGAVAQLTPLGHAQNNMKQIAVAIHNYAADHNSLPTNVYDANGKPILSWRVKILPYLEQDNLAKLFKMDEPWDSTSNKELLGKMPAVFQCPRIIGNNDEANTTPFRAFMGKDTLHQPNKKFNFPHITDGTSNTFLFIEAAKAVPWTCPDDLEYDPAKPFPAVGGRFGKDFLVTFCDGSTRTLPVATVADRNLTTNYFKMATPAGGEVIDTIPVKP